jgi:hypothetical protein
MPILPSTLEYSNTELSKKLKFISNNKTKFFEVSKQTLLELHIDLVYPGFAKSRSVMSSLNLTDNIKAIEDNIGQDFKATVHFMGGLEDVDIFRNELKKIHRYSKQIEIYIPSNMNKMMFDPQFQYYFWYDVDQLELNTSNTKSLQMSVKAGLSGQLLNDNIKSKLQLLANSRGVDKLIVDGGWKIEDCKEGLRMVSYSSFWKNLMGL